MNARDRNPTQPNTESSGSGSPVVRFGFGFVAVGVGTGLATNILAFALRKQLRSNCVVTQKTNTANSEVLSTVRLWGGEVPSFVLRDPFLFRFSVVSPR